MQYTSVPIEPQAYDLQARYGDPECRETTLKQRLGGATGKHVGLFDRD